MFTELKLTIGKDYCLNFETLSERMME